MRFYLGTHMPNWLRELDVPLFVSRTRLEKYKGNLPRAAGRWVLDSGAFSEIQLHGRWTLTATDYAALVTRYQQEVGGLEWAAPMDLMCEPMMLSRTGLTITDHQRMTVRNYLELRMVNSDLPIIPVLQGWARDDYLRCVELYAQAGVELDEYQLVGLGTICRRQDTTEAAQIVRTLAGIRLRLHGFGVKTTGLAEYGSLLESADSMAWSYDARRTLPLEGCTHRNCANCPKYAVAWRERLISQPLRYELALGL